jgi:hypothetical protein
MFPRTNNAILTFFYHKKGTSSLHYLKEEEEEEEDPKRRRKNLEQLKQPWMAIIGKDNWHTYNGHSSPCAS